MTRSELFTAAHALARQHHVAGESYSVTFGAALRHLLAAPTQLGRFHAGRRDDLVKTWRYNADRCAERAPQHPARQLLEDAVVWAMSPASDSYWRQTKIGEAGRFLSDVAAGRPHSLPF